MRLWLVTSCLLFAACGSNETDVKPSAPGPVTDTQATVFTDSSANASATDTTTTRPAKEIKKPSGIYQFILPYGETKILHTVAFYPESFRLQEEYLDKGDSTVTITGTWAPSQGFIWLYKDQLVRGRYTWKNDTLQYYSPQLKKSFSLTKLTPAGNNPAWQQKRKEGAIIYGVGTEPFWSIEVNKSDTIVFSSPEWQEPLRVKFSERLKGRDSTVFTAPQDSLQIVIYPYFCSDGMSDFTYTNKITVTYKGRSFSGCGQVF